FCEVDMVAHGGTSTAGSFIQTLTMVDVATGWTECLPLVNRDGSLVVEAIKRSQSLFPWLLRGVDFDNDSAFMNEVIIPWCREQKLEVTRSRAAHSMVAEAVKERLRAQYRALDPVALLAEIRSAQEELGNRVDRRAGGALPNIDPGKSDVIVRCLTAEAAAFARRLGNDLARGEPRATHRRPKRRYKKRIRMPSKLDPHVALIESWLAVEPQLTAIAIVDRLADLHPSQFGKKQHSIVQR